MRGLVLLLAAWLGWTFLSRLLARQAAGSKGPAELAALSPFADRV